MASKNDFLAALDARLDKAGHKRVKAKAVAQDVVPSGITLLDKYVLGCGGFPVGFAVELMGAEGAGKTTLCCNLVAQAQRLGHPCVWLDTEKRLVYSRMEALGVDLDALALLGALDIGEFEDQLLAVVAAQAQAVKAGGGPLLLVWDSLAPTPTAKEKAALDTGDKRKSGGIADRAREYSRIVRTIAGSVRDANIAMVAVNQLRTDIGKLFGDNQVSPGGAAMKYWAGARMSLRYPSNLKLEDKTLIGKAPICATHDKNLWAAPGRRAKLHLHFDGGWQNDLDIYEFGREHGLLAERVRNTPEAREHVLAMMEAAGWSLQHVDDGARSWSPKEAKSKTAGSKKAGKKPTAKKASKA